MTNLGHNSGAAGERIKSFIERVERLTEEKANIQSDIKDIWAEAKADGFDVKALKKIVKLRSADQQKLREEQETLEMYMNALGMLADTPLGQAAIERLIEQDDALSSVLEKIDSFLEAHSHDGEQKRLKVPYATTASVNNREEWLVG